MSARTAFLIIFVTYTCVFASASFASQQQQSNGPPCTEYENHNQGYYGPYVMEKIKGVITDPGQGRMANICVALFTEKDHKLVTTTQSDQNGSFSLEGIAPGRYQVVVKAYPLCAANVAMKVVRRAKKRKVLQVHMKPRGMDECSYGDLVPALSETGRK